jgi:hypothetical protein
VSAFLLYHKPEKKSSPESKIFSEKICEKI